MNTIPSNKMLDLRRDYTPKVVTACAKVLSLKKTSHERSKSSALALLQAVTRAPGGIGASQQIATVFKLLQMFLLSTNTSASSKNVGGAHHHHHASDMALRLDALSLVQAILSSTQDKQDKHAASAIRQHFKTTLLAELCSAVSEKWYKVIAEALRGLALVPYFFVVGYSDQVDHNYIRTERTEVATALYHALEPVLSAQDVDQEIKECALSATATLVSALHEAISSKQNERLLRLLLERLQNETTRTAAIRALSTIASTAPVVVAKETSRETMASDSTVVDISSIVSESLVTLASFLKLSSRSARQNALECLNVIVTSHGGTSSLTSNDGELYSKSVIPEVASLVTDADMHLCHLSL
jgi:cullin-associated NEDD8-dissociated protein 1